VFDANVLDTIHRVYAAFEAKAFGDTVHERFPPLARDSPLAHAYFTLAPALNFRRRSEQLWNAALSTFDDTATRFVFDFDAAGRDPVTTQSALTRHSLAIQPVRHTAIWVGLSRTFAARGGPRQVCADHDYTVTEILAAMRRDRAAFPALSGPKMANYWLYILDRFTDIRFRDRGAISIIPDVHVRRATEHLGLGTGTATMDADEVARIWHEGLDGTGIDPIDLHAPLWRWSRAGLPRIRAGFEGRWELQPAGKQADTLF